MRNVRKGKNLRWLLAFCIGLAGGTFLANEMVRTMRMDEGMVSVYIETLAAKPFNDFHFFIYICISRMAFFLLLTVLAMMFKSRLFFYAVTGIAGAAFGCTVSMTVMACGLYGVVISVAMLFPQYALYVPVYIFLLKMVDSRPFGDTMEHTSDGGVKRYALLISIVILVIMMGCALESYVNPFVVAQTVKFF